MPVKIVTDSSADLPADIVQALGITVVPLYVRFGEEVYRELVDISIDEFYRRLLYESVLPATSQPTPKDFAETYEKLAPGADGIVSIHISNKLSGTMSSALQARDMVKVGCPIEVIDSLSVTMTLGFVATAAADAARSGGSLAQVVAEAQAAVPQVHVIALLDTLKYLLLGGRIGRAKALVGSMLNVKPLVTMKDGEVAPAGQVRTRSKGVQRLIDFVNEFPEIQALSVLYNTTPDEARALAERLDPKFPKERIVLARLGTTLGTHLGPGLLGVSLREGKAR